MVKISLDTCAFFSMIRYNEIYNKDGIQALEQVLKENEEKIKGFEEKILNTMGPEFLKKHPNLSFEEKLEFYKDYATSLKTFAKNKFENYEKNAQGIFYAGGKEFRREISEQEKNNFLNKAQCFIQMYNSIPENLDCYKDSREDYKLLINNYNMGLIYKAALEGKYEFYISPTVYAEIQNHTDEKDSESVKGNIKFNQSKIDSLLKRCTFLSMYNKEIRDEVNKIAKEFRTKQNSSTKEMAPDINSLGLYGDSMIMAEASLAGIILITLNKKDFILDKSVKQNNDNIRKHISLVESQNAPITTDALPFSPTELLEGKIVEPTKQSIFEITLKNYEQHIKDYDENIAL